MLNLQRPSDQRIVVWGVVDVGDGDGQIGISWQAGHGEELLAE